MIRLVVVAFVFPALLLGEAGVLIPSTRKEPDPNVLSLAEMAIDIHINDGTARVLTRQIFHNQSGTILEGSYTFALPGRATVSDFAVWDDVTRIPGVILERRRAEEIYDSLRWQSIDPGILQLGERDADEARRSSVFTARIVPIPRHGTKRVELEYFESIEVEDLKSFFAVPLRPDAYRAQTAGRLWITLEMNSGHPVSEFEVVSKAYLMNVIERGPNVVRASFEGRNVLLSEDFAIRWGFDRSKADTLNIRTHREAAAPGFFLASSLIGPSVADSAAGPARTVVALFDISLSMQWEKLERSFEGLERLLGGLRPIDKFNLILFNTEARSFAPEPIEATPANVEKALESVRASNLRGGTDLEQALEMATRQAAGSNSYAVLFTDGGATRGTVQNAKLAAWYASQARPRTYVFAVGDDANIPLLKLLARQDGVLEWVRSTEPAEFKLNAFLAKIGRRPIESLGLTAGPGSNFDLVYPLEETRFAGSAATWAGRYLKPVPQATFRVIGTRDGKPLGISARAPLPARSLDNPHVPRLWARARVDALLEKIEREGEDRASIDEIIRLARKYKFVTPYTSFLAAPRALLRPRLIRPGDPVLRVRTDPSVVSVVALFPFGLVKPLRYLDREDTWQTRFLAPKDMADGTYEVRLLLRDREGRVSRESKTFVIASKPPLVRAKLDQARRRPGEAVRIRASATAMTRTITARMYGMPTVRLRWNEAEKASTADFVVPAHLPAGRYSIKVTAEDMAHNIGTQEVSLEVLP